MKVWNCLTTWARHYYKQELQQKPRKKRDKAFFSYLLGDQVKIDSINSKLAKTLKIYNDDFKGINRFTTLTKSNMNRLDYLRLNHIMVNKLY